MDEAKSKTRLRSYIWLVLRRACQHTLHSAHSIILVLIICAGLATYYVPQIQVAVDLGGWQVGALTVGAVFGVRLLLAPYWLWREQQLENEKLTQKLDQRKAREEALYTLALLRAGIAKLRIRMEADPQSKVDWTNELESLRAEVADKIKAAFGPAEAELYTTAGNLIMKSSVRVADRKHQLQLDFCVRDLNYLDDFIRQHSAALTIATR